MQREARGGFRPPAGMTEKEKFGRLEDRVNALEKRVGEVLERVEAILGKAPEAPAAPPLDAAEPVSGKAELVAKALGLKVSDDEGRPVSESILRRWSAERLEAAIAAKG
jgi:hypothetical protein